MEYFRDDSEGVLCMLCIAVDWCVSMCVCVRVCVCVSLSDSMFGEVVLWLHILPNYRNLIREQERP